MARTEYQIKLKSGMYVGLFNFGRTYKACKKAAWLSDIDLETAKKLARDFDGELTKRTQTYAVVCDFGYGDGTEVVCWCNDREDAHKTRDSYNENDRNHFYRCKLKWQETYIGYIKAAA